MNIQEKLKFIQNISKLSQTELANKIGVSFPAFNNWWTGKAIPRKKKEIIIDELYKEYTGQKIISDTELEAKKEIIFEHVKKYVNILETIFFNKDIYDQFLLSLTYNSNKIEGSTLSENETYSIMFDNVALPNKSLIEQLEVKNHQTALEFLFNNLRQKNQINENLILKLHSILMNGIKSDAGYYRNHAVRILGSYIPTANYLKIPELIKNLEKEFINKDKDIISQSTIIHSKFEQIHPFSDGNGRIGRLILIAMLLTENIAPAIIYQEKKQFYYLYLSKSQLKEEYSQLENFICDSILKSYDIIFRKLD